MEYRNSYITDANGDYIDRVLVYLEPDENGTIQENIQYYTLNEGERLVDAPVPSERTHAGTNGFITPRWDGTTWIEGATAEEIAAWEIEHPAPPPSTPTLTEQTRADVDYLLIMGGYTNELV